MALAKQGRVEKRRELAILTPSLRTTAMAIIEQMPMLYAAMEYSLLYMLCGGGLVGAVVVYFVARGFGK
jgi:sensor c-di-GMP phosphodiesterase-like protein